MQTKKYDKNFFYVEYKVENNRKLVIKCKV